MSFKKLIGISLAAIFLLSFMSSVSADEAMLWVSYKNGKIADCDHVFIDRFDVNFANGQTYNNDAGHLRNSYYDVISTRRGDGVKLKYPDNYGEAKSVRINFKIVRNCGFDHDTKYVAIDFSYY
ncbi:MAG: hypothetical protein LBD03_04045 [Methanobrevibacter sp.]|jgi:hypothetical protein|nr:hypothetical protein [Candidatus Methanovirga procula]